MALSVNETIARIREKMDCGGVDAVIIPSGDPHMSEYCSDHWKTRAFVSGFSGSAGTVVITKETSGLWTDGRYYVQAAGELAGSEIQLFRASEPDCPSYYAYLQEHLHKGAVIGLNAELFSAQMLKTMQKLWDKKEIRVDGAVDYANELWEERPAQELTEIFYLDEQYTGASAAEKIQQVRSRLAKHEAQALLVSKLDNVAWLFNIRAQDVLFNPVAIAYAYIDGANAVLFTDSSRLPEQVREILHRNGVTVKPYDAVFDAIASITEPTAVLCDENELNARLYGTVVQNPALSVCSRANPILMLKSCKNGTETRNTFDAYREDGCALAEFYAWLFECLQQGGHPTEYELTVQLAQFRCQQPHNRGESFQPIIGYRENAAMMHYAPHQDTAKSLHQSGMLLIDSGGQYLTGTTDTTRTFALGPITEEERRDFTLVLKSVIALSTAVFKAGTTGGMLDCLSRVQLWKYGLDYRCGTGHGVGFMLNVHEGPQGFGGTNQVPLKEGMVLTIEPGVYTEGSHGIRTENTAVVVKDQKTEYGQFYRLDTFTLVPIDVDCLELALLTPQEIQWLNDYHQRVYTQLAPLVSERARLWLQTKTRSL